MPRNAEEQAFRQTFTLPYPSHLLLPQLSSVPELFMSNKAKRLCLAVAQQITTTFNSCLWYDAVHLISFLL